MDGSISCFETIFFRQTAYSGLTSLSLLTGSIIAITLSNFVNLDGKCDAWAIG